MKSKIKRQISQSSTTLPLSFQERGRGELAENRADFVETTSNFTKDRNEFVDRKLKKINIINLKYLL